MKRLAALARVETSLWLHSVGFWLTALLMHLYTFGTFRFTTLQTSRGLSEQILGNGLLFAALFLLFTSAAVMLRDRAERTDELLDALPATNVQLLLSRWLGGAVVWLLLGLEIFALSGILIALQDGAVLELWPLASFYFALYVPAALFIHTLGMAAGALIQQPFILYPVLTGIWAGASLGVMALSFNQRWEFMTLFHLTGIGSSVQRISALAGIYPFQGYVFWQRVFFSGFMLLLLVLAFVVFRRHRESGDARRPRRLRYSLTGAFISVLLIALGSFGYIQQFTSAIGLDAEAASKLTPEIVVEAYDLHVRLNQPGSYDVTANLRVRNQAEVALPTIGLILPAACQVSVDSFDTISTAGIGAVTVAPSTPLAPGDMAVINLGYTCPTQRQDHKLPILSPREHMIDHIVYPRAQGGLRTVAHFTLTLEAPAEFKLATNLIKVAEEALASGRMQTRYEGEAVRLDVFGGPLAYEVIAGLETYYYPAHAAAARKYVTELANQIAFYKSWFGEAQYVPGITPRPIVVENFFISSLGRFPTSQQGFLSVSEWQMPSYYGGVRPGSSLAFDQYSQALSLWWGANPLRASRSMFVRTDDDNSAITVAANQYLMILYTSERDGDIWYEQALAYMKNEWAERRKATNNRGGWSLSNELGLHSRGDYETAVFLTLHDLRESLGDDALRTVLQALHQRHITLAQAAFGTRPSPLSPPIVSAENRGSTQVQPSNAASQMPRLNTDDEDLRFLFATIAALPDGTDIAERLLQYLPESTENRLRQQWGLSE